MSPEEKVVIGRYPKTITPSSVSLFVPNAGDVSESMAARIVSRRLLTSSTWLSTDST